MSIDLAAIGLSTIRRVTDLWAASKADSLIDYTKVARVEPTTLIDADVLFYEGLNEVQQSLLSIFAGYYLQAVALSASVGRVEVMRHLDKLNPKRSATDSAANTAGWLMASENYKDRLPRFDSLGLEAIGDRFKNDMTRNDTDMPDSDSDAFGRDNASTLRELTNLSVGKMFNVTISDNGHSASIPIAIRLMASTMPTRNLIHILSIDGKDNSAKERYHAWRAGRIEFIKDLVLCQDLIDAHRKNLMQDKDGTYTSILKQARGNQLSTIVSGNPSVATASNIAIVSQETVGQLEMELNCKFGDFKAREKIFKSTYLMIVAVINKQYDRVTFYHRGINGHTEASLRDLKSANKGSGPDVSDILKAYQFGNSPSL
jgi:hypothetical protein